ncbi:MAG: hypothetical protein JWO94_2305 [Verrucomicrobiaceae bacterium]|nr:hypothetical protein [Verrucomicrobiaceae bacterium]
MRRPPARGVPLPLHCMLSVPFPSSLRCRKISVRMHLALCLIVSGFSLISAAPAPPDSWLPLRVAEVSLQAPFGFLPKRDGLRNLPAPMRDQFASFDIYESETTGTFPMAVNLVRIQYRDASHVNLDGTCQSSLLAVAETQGDKDAAFDKNTITIDGLDARRVFYNGLGRGRPVSVETVAARQDSVLWTVMVTYNKKVPREAVTRLLDSVHFIPPEPAPALSVPGGPAAETGTKWFITSLDEVTLECPFTFPARRDALLQLQAPSRDQFISYDTWEGTGRPALPMEVTLSRLTYKDSETPSLERIALNQIKALALRAGDSEENITTSAAVRDGLAARLVHYDGLARGKKLSTEILLVQDGPRVWIVQAGWSAGTGPAVPSRLLDSVHIITPSPDFALSPAMAEPHTLIQDLTQTYGWYDAQRATLEAIARSLPGLAGEAARAHGEFENVFRAGAEGVSQRLQQASGKDWPGLLSKFDEQSAGLEAAKFDKAAALDYLGQVRERSRGRIESPVREMLLASTPAYAQQPVLEFKAGYTGFFTTVGQPKANGLRFNFKHPLSWSPQAVPAPDVVRQWTSDGGHGYDYIRLSVVKLPPALSADAVEAVFTDQGARSLMPEGGQFLRFRQGTLNDQPLGILHFIVNPAGGGSSLPPLRCVMYYLILPGNLLSIQGLVTPPPNATEAAREDRFTRLEPLFQAVAGSLMPVP